MSLKILIDENIPNAEDFFGCFGEVRLVSGRDISSKYLKDVDVLLVRSITRVDERLLGGCPVQFVGSTTIGSDHVDHRYLQQAGIAFANAPGSNANSVAEYVLSAILALSERDGFSPAEKTLGIVGYGNVGRRVSAMMKALGVTCLVYDPLLEVKQEFQSMHWSTFDELLSADIISLHVPLSRSKPYPTYHMFDQVVLERLADTLLINTSRGAVIDNRALKKCLLNRRGVTELSVVLDVWEGEPNIDLELLERAAIATPHIAGYSAIGKLNGVIMIRRALCEFLGCEEPMDGIAGNQSLQKRVLGEADYWEMVRQAVCSVYDVRKDDRLLRGVLREKNEVGDYFDSLRKNYRERKEFSSCKILTGNASVLNDLRNVGFV